MHVFVLCTGRCGSTTVAKAFEHATNYSVGHESRTHLVEGRLDYPDWHIEVDNRLSWHLGSLDKLYGREPLYVHLYRDHAETVASYARRFTGRRSIVRAMAQGITYASTGAQGRDWTALADLAVSTVTDNIELFLRGKPNVLRIRLETLAGDFALTWKRAGCEGDLDGALAALVTHHNATPRGAR